ncbi:MAG: phosphoribosyltransferase [Candidatus Woesearchaeota archaeon]
MFKNRKEAGKLLAKRLEGYKDKDPIVFSITKEGIFVGKEVAEQLDVDFSVLMVSKLPHPTTPYGWFGAISERGDTELLEDEPYGSEEVKTDILKKLEKEKYELRGGPLPDLWGKTVILVDDGINQSLTMKAAIKTCRKMNPEEIIVAVPVTGSNIKSEMKSVADYVIVLETPELFYRVKDDYLEFEEISFEDAKEIYNKR